MTTLEAGRKEPESITRQFIPFSAVAWLFAALIAGGGIFISWPSPPPDPHFNMQSVFDQIDEQSTTGMGHEKTDRMDDWYDQADAFGWKCTTVLLLAELCGLSAAYCLCGVFGYGQLKRRHFLAWLAAGAGGLIAVFTLPKGPPDPVWGRVFEDLALRYAAGFAIVAAAVCVLAMMVVTYGIQHRVYRSPKAWVLFTSISAIICLACIGHFLMREEWSLQRSNAFTKRLVLVRFMPELKWLDISNTMVDDDELRHLAGKDLRELNLSRTNITGDGLNHLTSVESLYSLDLSRTKIGDQELSCLKSISGLTSLDLSSTPISDEALIHLSEIPELGWLHLTNTEISDEGLKHLAGMPKLEFLELSCTNISDAGLAELLRLPSLRTVFALQSQVTAAGAEQFETRLPHVLIFELRSRGVHEGP